MVRVEKIGEQVRVMSAGLYPELLDDATGMISWIIRFIKPEDIATILVATYELCQEDPDLQQKWDETEVMFEDSRRQMWNEEFYNDN